MSNEKKLADYLPYYIGQRVQTPDGIGHLVGLNWHIMQNDRVTVHFGHMVKTQNSIDGGEYNVRAQRMEPIGSTGVTEDGFDVPGGVTLILRPLSSMTEEEDKECSNIMFGEFADKVKHQNIIHYEGEKIRYLLSKGFDIFNLRESGLAIYQEEV